LLPVNLSIIKDPYDGSSSSSELSPKMQIGIEQKYEVTIVTFEWQDLIRKINNLTTRRPMKVEKIASNI
jgi:hypothetical protein